MQFKKNAIYTSFFANQNSTTFIKKKTNIKFHVYYKKNYKKNQN